jgi:hypothetical protein
LAHLDKNLCQSCVAAALAFALTSLTSLAFALTSLRTMMAAIFLLIFGQISSQFFGMGLLLSTGF